MSDGTTLPMYGVLTVVYGSGAEVKWVAVDGQTASDIIEKWRAGFEDRERKNFPEGYEDGGSPEWSPDAERQHVVVGSYMGGMGRPGLPTQFHAVWQWRGVVGIYFIPYRYSPIESMIEGYAQQLMGLLTPLLTALSKKESTE